MEKRRALFGAVVFGLVVIVLLAACCLGCATRRAYLRDSDGSKMVVNDLVFMSKRDLATASGSLERSADGSGKWVIGDTSQNNDATQIVEKLPDLFKFLGQVFSAYLQYSSAGAETGSTTVPSVEGSALSPLMR